MIRNSLRGAADQVVRLEQGPGACWMAKRRIALLITASCILWPFAANAQREPHPPCETSSPFPEFSPPGHTPNYRVWN